MKDQSQSALANGPDRSAHSSVAEALRAEICSYDNFFSLMEANNAPSSATAKRTGFNGWAPGRQSPALLAAEVPTNYHGTNRST